MRQAVIDTNVVVSALVFQSRLSWLRQAWKSDCSPVICSETTEESLRVLSYPKFKLTAACPLVSGDADLTVLRGVAALSILSAAELKFLLYEKDQGRRADP